VPKALVIDDDTPRRRHASRTDAQEIAQDTGFLLRMVMRYPKDVAAGSVAAIAAVAIIVNAAFMQAGRHPAPMFSAVFPDTPAESAATPGNNGPLPRPRPSDADVHADIRAVEASSAPVAKAAPAAVSPSNSAPRPPAPIPARADPVGDLIVSTRRITTVQRVLTEFGYGQLKPTGVGGPETRAAIERFERDRKIPVTGLITDRLVRDLSAATGRPID